MIQAIFVILLLFSLTTFGMNEAFCSKKLVSTSKEVLITPLKIKFMCTYGLTVSPLAKEHFETALKSRGIDGDVQVFIGGVDQSEIVGNSHTVSDTETTRRIWGFNYVVLMGNHLLDEYRSVVDKLHSPEKQIEIVNALLNNSEGIPILRQRSDRELADAIVSASDISLHVPKILSIFDFQVRDRTALSADLHNAILDFILLDSTK